MQEKSDDLEGDPPAKPWIDAAAGLPARNSSVLDAGDDERYSMEISRDIESMKYPDTIAVAMRQQQIMAQERDPGQRLRKSWQSPLNSSRLKAAVRARMLSRRKMREQNRWVADHTNEFYFKKFRPAPAVYDKEQHTKQCDDVKVHCTSVTIRRRRRV